MRACYYNGNRTFTEQIWRGAAKIYFDQARAPRENPDWQELIRRYAIGTTIVSLVSSNTHYINGGQSSPRLLLLRIWKQSEVTPIAIYTRTKFTEPFITSVTMIQCKC